MRNIFITISLVLVGLTINSCIKKSEKTENMVDEEIEKILSSLTLEEKVGQMTNLTLETVAYEQDGKIKIDTTKLRNAFVNHHIGSIQNVIKHAYTIEEWRDMVNQMQKMTLEQTRHKIPTQYRNGCNPKS